MRKQRGQSVSYFRASFDIRVLEKPQRGTVSYDSIDLNSLEPRSLRRQTGCVLQDDGLFTDSIRANITLTDPFAADEEVREAARLAGIDEATSALDNNTQKIITDTLASLHCTRIVIAHRLSTVKQCDRIVMMEEGRIIEEGTYEELMERNGRFAELVKRQLK